VQAASASSNSHQQWHCEGDTNKEWRCSDLSEAGKTNSGSEKRAALATDNQTDSTQATAQTERTPAETKPVAITKPTLLKPDRKNTVAVQLIAARQQQTIKRFAQQHPQLQTQLITIEKNNEQWQLLLLGVYPSYAEAKAAIAAISPPLTNAPWIRPLAPLQSQQINPPSHP